MLLLTLLLAASILLLSVHLIVLVEIKFDPKSCINLYYNMRINQLVRVKVVEV